MGSKIPQETAFMTACTLFSVPMLLCCAADEPDKMSTVAMDERSLALVGWMVGE